MSIEEELNYTRVEYERRFLVDPASDWKTAVESYSKRFEDKYISGTRLRLRVLTDSDTGRRVIKLTKKSESPSPYFRTVSRILLSSEEFDIFNRLEGHSLIKTRYYHDYHGRVFSIDVFDHALNGLLLCETEASDLDELMRVEPPPYAMREVTEDSFFDGGNLCRATRADLISRLALIM